MNILITGGAGYIGSIANAFLQKKGYETVVFDNFSNGNRWAIGDTPYVDGDICKKKDVARAFALKPVDAVLHCAGLISAGESMQKPGAYYEANVMGTIRILEGMREYGCRDIIFSSTGSVYHPSRNPSKESSRISPAHVYGETKKMGEDSIMRYASLYGMRYGILRYTNAAGAALDYGLGQISLGEAHHVETHLLPRIVRAALGRDPFFSLFGTDYPTEDGTAVRDYVHVLDVVSAQEKALRALRKHDRSFVCNIGTGVPVSTRQLITSVERILKTTIPLKEMPRRKGDPAMVVADNSLAQETLGWRPTHSKIDTIIRSVIAWERERAA